MFGTIRTVGILFACAALTAHAGNPVSRVYAYEVVVIGEEGSGKLFKAVYAAGCNMGIGHEPNGGVTTLEIPKSELPPGKTLTVAVRPSSAANHTAIATGVTAKKTGVYNNGETPKGNFAEWPSWLARVVDVQPDVKALFTYTWDGDVGLSQLRRCAT